jgi:serine phosphatase RsbU (regulator of sigma subunit)/FixJ family two-component response regulator
MLKPIILCVDDEKTVLNSLRQELEFSLGNHFVFELAESGEEGLEIVNDLLARGMDLQVVISDQLMPGMKGDQFLIEVNKLNQDIRKILLTGQANAESVGNAVNNANLYRYIAKPWDEKDLRLTVEEAAKSFALNKQLSTQVKILGDLNRSAKVLSEEVHPHQLAQKFLQSAMNDSGAGYGYLEVYFGPSGVYRLEMATSSAEPAVIESADDVHKKVPFAALDAVKKTRKPLVLHNASQQGEAVQDPVVKARAVKSVYCSTVAKNDQILGVLYLEHPNLVRFFGNDKQEFLNLLTAHASICLDNAVLYQSLEDKVEERTHTIQEKTRAITDSIEYARRIQLSILPALDQLQERFAQNFVFYLPKDIVSGDFYWFAEVGGYFYITAVDCTGHGVPGAFMSVLGNNFLNQIVKEEALTSTSEILYKLHNSVRDALKQYDEQATVQDGMDIALCRIDKAHTELQFSGARRPLYLFRQGQVTEFKGGRYPAGGSIYTMNPNEELFTQSSFALQPGDMIYLSTDGFADQFGGADGRKFSQKRFVELLSSVYDKPMDQQKAELQRQFDAWKGTRTQTDDVLVLGIRL